MSELSTKSGALRRDLTGGAGNDIADALIRAKIHNLAVLPETWLTPLLHRVNQRDEFKVIRLTREEEGIGICTGLALAGVGSALLMQNTGLLASANALVTIPLKYRVPLLMLVSYRGAPGEDDDRDYHLLEGELTEPALAALRIPVFRVRTPDEAENIVYANTRAQLAKQPVAVLLSRGALMS